MSRRVFVLGVALALLALTFALTDWWLGRQPCVTEANFKRIREGMTMQEVEAILGAPGDRMAGPGVLYWRWQGESGTAVVGFDGTGKVREFLFNRSSATARPGFLRRLRSWLGW
jgi:hypothetical protein